MCRWKTAALGDTAQALIQMSLVQKRVLRTWLAFQRRRGPCVSEDTEAKLQELCAAEGWNPDDSDGEDNEEEMDNSEPLDDSDVILSESGRLYSAALLSRMQFWLHPVFSHMVSR